MYLVSHTILGYAANTLKGLFTGLLTLTELVALTVTMDAYTGYGTANNRHDILGLDTISPSITMALYNVSGSAAMTAPTGFAAVVGVDGQYTFNFTTGEATTGQIVRLTITGATGYEFSPTTFVAL